MPTAKNYGLTVCTHLNDSYIKVVLSALKVTGVKTA